MPRKFIRRFLPDPHKIRDHKSIKMFGTLLHEPNLWHLNRRSIASAFAVGLFFMWIPVPFQMVLAAGAAIIIRSNLPISVALVWISNPLTMPPMFYFAYLLGTWILGVNEMHFVFEPTMDWLKTEMLIIWKPFVTGCLTLAIVSSALGFAGIRLFWRLAVLRYLDKKKKNRR